MRKSILLALSLCIGLSVEAADRVTIFAAASMSDALKEVSDAYTQSAGTIVQLSFAASSALARQIESGAKADVFFSADTDWMDYLQARNLIDPVTRQDVLRNRLVLIAPAESKSKLRIGSNFPLAAALGKNRLATGDPDSVPVGKYAKSALTNLGVWNSMADRVVRADNVRVALAYVARGEAAFGIVYATDALMEKKVRVVDFFPDNTHLPIVYPIALTRVAAPTGKDYVAFVVGPKAGAIFRKYGFITKP
jgi:molybdate transport system substrate-binding protein